MQGNYSYYAVLCVSGNIADLYGFTFTKDVKHIVVCSSSYLSTTLCRFHFLASGGYGIYFSGNEKIILNDINLPRNTQFNCGANVANTRIIVNMFYDDTI